MFFHVKENTLNEEKFLSICHECGYEPELYDKCDDTEGLNKKYIVSLNTPTYSPATEENIAVVFTINYKKKYKSVLPEFQLKQIYKSVLAECIVYNKIKIVNYDGQCYLTTLLNGISVSDPAIFENELKSITKEVKLFNITEKLRRIRNICKDQV